MGWVLTLARYLFLVLLYVFLFQLVRGIAADLKRVRGEEPIAEDQGSPAFLVVGSGPLRGTRFVLQDYVFIGRDPGNHVVLSEPTVSARHAVIVRKGEDYWLQDLGSTNGTRLNGTPVKGLTRLKTGDKLTLGEVTLKFLR
jgi:pSer/pThr/pTyr-binding forkhead associated (FHA) protein